MARASGAGPEIAPRPGRDERRPPRIDEGAVLMEPGERSAGGGGGQCFLTCPRCRLTIKLRAPWLAIRFCPRCLARSETVIELFSSPVPAEMLYADGSAPRGDRQRTDRRLGLP